MTSSRVLARNSALNVMGQVVPVAIALVTIPLLVRGFGAERFGVLTLVWAAIGYFGLFELGIGRALTQAVARRLGAPGQAEIPVVARTGILLLLGLGAMAGLVILAASEPLSTRVLHIPQQLEVEAIATFRLLGVALPFVLATAGLRGIMEAHQHFGVTTALRIPSALFSFAGPLVTLPLSRSLVPAISVIAAGRVLVFLAHVVACARAYPELRSRSVPVPGVARDLLHFGAWTTVSNIVSPMMVYLDRFVIGATLGLVAVTAYVTPYEAVSRLLIIPGALTGVLLPELASAMDSPARMRDLYDRALRAIALLMFPLVLCGVALAKELLALWAGDILPTGSTVVLQWLSAGVYASAIAHAPATAFYGAGKPDVIARLHLIELPVYAIFVVVLLRLFGLHGIAIAWTARAILDAAALSWLARRKLGLASIPAVNGWALGALPLLLIAAALLPTTGWRLLFVIVVGTGFLAAGWRIFLQASERVALRAFISGAVARVAPSR